VQILPSSRASADQDLAGLELAPFRGVRYAQDRVSGLAEVTSPPYDVIFRDKEDQLMAADPHNVVRLILPRPVPARPGEEYHHAAVLLREWLDEHILAADPVPALYVYEQVADDVAGADEAGQSGSSAHQPAPVQPAPVQRGLIGALKLVRPDAGIVLPHEDVASGPVAGRRQLMEATEANLEPIFLLYDGGPDGAATRIVAETAAREPLLEARTADGVAHRLWAVTDPCDLAAIAADLAPRQALIADGHHRYAAYLQLQELRHMTGHGAGPWDYGLALLVDSAAYPPRIGAIHRVIPGLDVHQAAKLAAAAFSVHLIESGTADLTAAVDKLRTAGATGPAFVLAGGDQAFLLTDPDPEQVRTVMPAGRSRQWRALSAAVLQELLITRLWDIVDDDDAVRVVHHDAQAALRSARSAGGTAVLCNPMSPAEVYAVAARGEKIPRKSTSFDPKPRTGLVLRTFAVS